MLDIAASGAVVRVGAIQETGEVADGGDVVGEEIRRILEADEGLHSRHLSDDRSTKPP